jgi:NADPH:quinone reductase-like Zn-dependent oxidoreductase
MIDMQTIKLGETPGLEQLVFADDALPRPPGRGEILVRVEASSLNGHDYNVAIGRLPCTAGRILLTDAAGTVEAVGEGVSEFAPGDAVISCFFPLWQDGDAPLADFSATPGDGVDGYGCSHVVRPAQWFTKAPVYMTPAEAATLPTAGMTAWRALVQSGGLKAGDSVLVMGTGGVSIFALQLAKSMGATVIATSSSDEKLARAKALGADHVINYRTCPEWGQEVRKLTGGRGVDHVVEVGGPATLPQSITACRIGGHIALIGVLTGISGVVPTVAIMSRQQRVHGITVGSRTEQQAFVRALEAIQLKPVIDRGFAMADLRDAFDHYATGDHFGKISVTIS